MENSTSSSSTSALHNSAPSDGNASLYILIVMSFYGFFLCAIMLGYFRSKRREKRRVNVFTKLVHDKEKQEWGAMPSKKFQTAGFHSLPLSFCSSAMAGQTSALACALCVEDSSVSSLCSDTRVAIEEEDDSGTAEEGEEKGSGDDSG